MDINIIFKTLLSPNNQQRQQAEEAYNSLFKEPSKVIPIHIQIIENSDDSTRLLAANLLSRNFYKVNPSLYFYLNENDKQIFKNKLIQYIQMDVSVPLLRSFSSLLYDVFAVSLNFPELFDVLKRLVESNSEKHKSIALSTMGSLLLFGEVKETFRQEAVQYAVNNLNGNASIVVSCLELYKVALNISEEEGRDFENIVIKLYPQFLNAVMRIVQSQPEDSIPCLSTLIEIHDDNPFFFDLLQETAMVALNALQQLEGTDGTPAMELLCVLCESYEQLGNAMTPTLQLLFRWLTTIEDSKEWYECKNENEESLSYIAEDFVYRLVKYASIKEILALCPNQPNWQQARAFIVMINFLISSRRDISEHIPQLLQSFLTIINMHPRITVEVISFTNKIIRY